MKSQSEENPTYRPLSPMRFTPIELEDSTPRSNETEPQAPSRKSRTSIPTTENPKSMRSRRKARPKRAGQSKRQAPARPKRMRSTRRRGPARKAKKTM